ncbi:MAG TPA: hypothetical protein VHZ03_07125 [Trebonia sp.]|jgi:hypothetical protein|nr:hypothetical protein [Trebonia sp.]
MSGHRCACGFEAGDEAERKDHFLEVFAPKDGVAADGTIHEEGRVNLTCMCGFSASTVTGLDDHFLTVFVPAGGASLDGVTHSAVGSRQSD